MKFNHRLRIHILLFLTFLVVLVFVARLFHLQVVEGDYYTSLADQQYLKNTTSFFNRGSIYFKNKQGVLISAASLKQDFLLTINPRMIIDPDSVYDLLSKVVEIDKEHFFNRLARNSMYEEIAQGLTAEQADQINSLDIRGVYLIKQKKRYYPAQNTASHVLGFMAYQGEDYSGRYGLEKYYNQELSHRNTGSFASFFAEVFLGVSQNIVNAEVSQREGDLILTIEPIVQATVERELEQTIEKWKAESGGIVVMDPHTGAIVAMAAWPNFNPGERQSDIAVLPNPLVERVFEVGSVIKTLTIAAGLDGQVITPGSEYTDQGFVVLNNRQIMNHDKKSHGKVTMQKVLDQSLNTGAIHVMQLLGREKFRQYMINFGLTEKTGIDLPDELSGLTRNLNSTREVDYATASFGQGIAITPIQAVRSFAVLANGGKLVKPYVVDSIKYSYGGEKKTKSTILKENVISRKAADDITEMMVQAVDKALVGGAYKLEHHAVAAKTGTAQIAKPEGGYYDDRYLHSFFGYYPAYNPKFIMFTYLTNPKDTRFASETLPEPFMNIARFMINYYELPPDRPVINESVSLNYD